MPPSGPLSFAEATSINQLTSHTYSADFPDDWCIGTVPHGGFVTSCFLRVANLHFNTTLKSQNQPHTITLHLDFLRRTSQGPAHFTVKDVKLGRQTSVIHMTLTQGSRQEVVGYITNSNMHTESGLSFDTKFALSPTPLRADLGKLKENGKDQFWHRHGDMPFAEFRKASSKVLFHFPTMGQPSVAVGDEWLCFANGDKFTNASLGYVADMFAMPVEAFLREKAEKASSDASLTEGAKRKAAKFWYPTLVLNLDFKKPLPEEGVEWLFSRCGVKKIHNGRMDLEIIICDEAGDVVALSHHVTLILGAERNMAERRKEDSKI